jgi:hypothetical protein
MRETSEADGNPNADGQSAQAPSLSAFGFAAPTALAFPENKGLGSPQSRLQMKRGHESRLGTTGAPAATADVSPPARTMS